jgi:hypothetical protein
MRIKLLTGRAGLDGVYEAGDVIEVPDAEGQRMVKGRHAERVEDYYEVTPPRDIVESMAVRPPSQASLPRPAARIPSGGRIVPGGD